jgi:hypothetical protein
LVCCPNKNLATLVWCGFLDRWDQSPYFSYRGMLKKNILVILVIKSPLYNPHSFHLSTYIAFSYYVSPIPYITRPRYTYRTDRHSWVQCYVNFLGPFWPIWGKYVTAIFLENKCYNSFFAWTT